MMTQNLPKDQKALKQQKIYQETFLMIQCGDLSLNEVIDQAILLIGNTKAGKTTSGHYLSGQLLTAYRDQDTQQLNYKSRDDGRYQTAIIGANQRQSQTQIPNFFQSSNIRDNLMLVDCPGYHDSFGCSRIVSNGYFHYKIFSKIRKMKFILTVEFTHLLGTGNLFRDCFKEFCQGFKNLHQIKDAIFDACSVLITKVPNNRDLASVLRLWETANDIRFASRPIQAFFNEFLVNMRIGEKIFLFYQPQKIQATTQSHNQVLKNIDEKIIKYWVRNLDINRNPTIQNLRTSISDRLIDNDDPNPEIKQLGEYFTATILGKLDSFEKVMQILIKDAFSKEDNCQYYKQIEKYVQKYVKPKQIPNSQYQRFQPKRQQVRETLFMYDRTQSMNSGQQTHFWLKKIMVTSRMYEITTRLNQIDNYDPSFNQQRIIITKQVLQDLIWLSRRSELANVQKFCYEIYKTIDLSINFYNIMSTSDQPNPRVQIQDGSLNFILQEYPLKFKDCFVRLFNDSVLISKINYFKNFKVVGRKDCKSEKQVKDISNFIQNLINHIERLKISDFNLELNNMSQEEIDNILVQLKKKILNIKLAYYQNCLQNLCNAAYQSTKTILLFRQINDLRAEIEEIFNQLRLDAIDDPTFDMMRISIIGLLGEILLKLDADNLALKLFDFIQNPIRIFKIFDERIKAVSLQSGKNQYKFKLYEAYMKMAVRYHRKQLALEKAQHAYHQAQALCDSEKIKKISLDLKDIQLRKSQINNYQCIYEQIRTKEFPPELIQGIEQICNNVKTGSSSPVKSQRMTPN